MKVLSAMVEYIYVVCKYRDGIVSKSFGLEKRYENGQIKWRRNELNLNIVSFKRDRRGLRIHQIMFFKKIKGYFYKVLYAQGD